MKIATINWSDVKGEASVNFLPEFEQANRTIKLDALQDALAALEDKYNEVYGAMS
jgi:hypothetical protein